MTDQDLIYMLRNNVGVSEAACRAAKVAADRIEQLAATCEELVKERDGLLRVVTDNHVALQRAEAAEAKLTECEARLSKAVETIRELMYKYEYPQEQWKTRAVLAELEGK